MNYPNYLKFTLSIPKVSPKSILALIRKDYNFFVNLHLQNYDF